MAYYPFTEDLLRKYIERLIVKDGVSVFLFGSKSEFNNLCLEVVTSLKEKYPFIKRVYVRAEYPIITEDYKEYLLQRYEDTYYPEKISGAGNAVYIERNIEMINKSDVCVFYYKEGYTPPKTRSGTAIVFEYALAKKKKIIDITIGL